jgi:hypothetical protein
MKRAIFAAVLAGLCVGQMCTGPAPAPQPGRLDVTDRLRAACASLPDAQIESLLMDVEADRLNGATMQQLVTAANQTCIGRGGECSQCLNSIIRQVFEAQ